MRALSALLTILCCAACPALAWADHEGGGQPQTQVTVMTSAPSSSSTTSALVLITATNPFVLSSSSTTTAETLFGSADHTERHLRANAVALQADISVGGGQAVEDLAALCGVTPADRPAFGRLLREHRQALVALVDPDALSTARAVAFADTIEQAMRQDQALRRYTR